MVTFKVPSTLRYSIATFSLCTSAFVTGVFIYPLSVAILNSIPIPIFFVAIASVSAIITLSLAIYLVKSLVPAINNNNVCDLPEEKQNSNDILTEMPLGTIPLPPPLPNQNSGISGDFLTQVKSIDLKKVKSQGRLKNQSDVNHESICEQIREGVKLKKVEVQERSNLFKNEEKSLLSSLRKKVAYSSCSESESSGNESYWNDSDKETTSNTSKRFLDSTTTKNSSFAKSNNQNADFQNELKERLEKISEESEYQQDLSNIKIKDSKDNAKNKMQQKYVEKIENQKEEKNKVGDQNNRSFMHSIASKCVPSSNKPNKVKNGENGSHSSGYSSDLENQSIQSKKPHFWKKFLKKTKKVVEDDEVISL
ncbi:hypothetical protein HGO53_07070 [Wolbachia endosymbiont of Diaphorina citri]|jgi:hypothetical protein|uniref:hypothetical protein n=1 Tax=Wolbachia endosymbiont of Diaphorina citri TaxID=116598 RepID=UPI00155DEF21|nr:hypothetical protein [Wolbachia endosymbiont of Diaphorina citri]QJT94844.1 hypothetical protein HGO48_05800 [Wolbachia endosymbiont of Diaphorina citri]QJT96157.1 hypothetical protein HGO49_06360 [Wolbachia endosymbiont of Diaphorina citri]QJT97525.1 hypothetical protein HGO53_07070 [Wolbachia endosymbiont of Diaphorina citri]QLK11792.1 hypothetical protein FK497_06245 [Wolbachia endosymbiont of Diaphorina citri]QLK12009.1 hypothetical protein FK497_07700 [Wolbachia endosymbiont of Diaphor